MSAKKFFIHLICAALLACLAALPAAAPVQGLICEWEGDISNAWDEAGNWSCGAVPGSGDVVDIRRAGYDPVLNGSTEVFQVNLYVGSIPAGTRGGYLFIVGGATLTTAILNLNGQISGPGAVVVTNTWNWGNNSNRVEWDGRLSGGGSITIQAGAHGKFDHVSTDGAHLDNYTINNYGVIEPYTNFITLAMGGGAVIHNYGIFAADGEIFDDYLILGYNSSIVNHAGATMTIYNNAIGASKLDTVLINDGSLEIKKGDLTVCSGGPHNGSFSGLTNARLTYGYCEDIDHTPTGSITFNASSSITVPHVVLYTSKPGRSVSIAGAFGPIGTTSSTSIQIPTTFQAGATVTSFGDTLTLYYPLTLLTTVPNNLTSLQLSGALASWNYPGTVTVWTSLTCAYGATMTGGGLLRVRTGATMTITGSSGNTGCRLDGFTLENDGRVNWNYPSNIVGLNSATLNNDTSGVFTANSGGTLSGSLTFLNNGLLEKKGAGTTTTIDVPFTNNGSIDVLAGNLVFTQDVTLPDTSDNTITGIFRVANLINNGILVVDGTIDGNLTNNGTLELDGTVTGDLTNTGFFSPGSSPGLTVVSGDFFQTSAGGIGIDLSKDSGSPGKPPVPGVDYDQLRVTGSAELAGHVQFSAGGAFDPNQYEVELPFLTAEGGITGGFETVGDNFPDYPFWRLIHRTHEVVFRFGSVTFLPLLRR